MYEDEKFNECLNMIKSIDYLIKGDDSMDSTVQEWTSNWPYKLVHLKTLPALSETREFLTNMKIEIGGKYSIQLADDLLSDLRDFCKNKNTQQTIVRLQCGTSDKSSLKFEEKFQNSIKTLIHELNRCEELASSFKLYQDKFIVELKSIIKNYLPHEPHHLPATESSQDLVQNQKPSSSGSKLSRLIKEQTPMEFQDMIMNIFTQTSEALRRLYGHQKLLLDISLSEIASIDSSSENQHNMITQLDIRGGINEAIRIIQLRMGKIIAVRREMTSTLRADHFLKLYSICVLFIQECETLSGEFLTKYLSDVLAAQLKNYISGGESRNIRTIQKKIEIEKWTPFIVESSVQRDVNDIVSSIDLDPINWTAVLDLTQETETDFEENGVATDGNPPGHRKSVVVGDKTFVASASLITTIEIIKELLVLSVNIPPMYLPSCERSCFSAMKYFNTATMASVMDGGRPLSKSGKNLSIMGESLDCMAEFVGIAQRFFQRLSDSYKDFIPYEPSNYAQLLSLYQSSSDRLYQAHAPPPPV